MSSRIKQIVISIGIVAATGGAMVALSAFNKPPALVAAKPSAQFVLTSEISQGQYQPIHRVIGDIEAGQTYHYAAVSSADVLGVYKQSGDWAKKGDLILALDATNAQRDFDRLLAQLNELKASQQMQLNQHALDKKLYEFDKKQLKQAQASLTREQKLSSKNLSSNSRLEQLQNEVDSRSQQMLQRELVILNHKSQQQQMNASLKQLQLSVDAQQSNLDDHQVIAKFDGQVSNLNLKVGEKISAGQSLLTLIDDQRFFKTVVSASLLEKSEQKTPQLQIANSTFELSKKNPLLEADTAGHTLWFDVSGSEARPSNDMLVGSRQYANWVSEGIEDSYLVSNRALFEFERIYFLKEKTPEGLLEEYLNKDKDDNNNDEVALPETQKPEESLAEDNKNEESELLEAELTLDHFDNWYELVEVKVNLHGSLQKDEEQFWIVTSVIDGALPDNAMILASQIKPLYSGMMVTDEVPKEGPKKSEKKSDEQTESENDDKKDDQAGDA